MSRDRVGVARTAQDVVPALHDRAPEAAAVQPSRRFCIQALLAGLVLAGMPGRARPSGDAVSPQRGDSPHVFVTSAELAELAANDARPLGSAKAALASRAAAALRSADMLTATFSGCSLDRYLHLLTYEVSGAARSASELALYAALCAENPAYDGGKIARPAAALARLVLTRWASDGLRAGGRLRSNLDDFCDAQGRSTQDTRFAVGLQLGRGLPYWIQAHDLLRGLGALSPADDQALSAFLDHLVRLVEVGLNTRFAESRLGCNRFSNHTSVALAALLAAARFRQDDARLVAVGSSGAGAPAITWARQVRHAVYGPDPEPLTCYPNEPRDTFFQIQPPQPGELADRYRAGKAQTFGYPMFSLAALLLGSDLLSSSAAGAPIAQEERPRLLSAVHYYAPFFAQLSGPDEAVVPVGFGAAGAAQYAGKLVSSAKGVTIECADGLILPFLLALRWSGDDAATLAVVDRAASFQPRFEAYSRVPGLYFAYLLPLQRRLAAAR